MTIARSTGVFLGTDETTGITIANNATSTSSELDLLGDNASDGEIDLFLKFTSTVTAGTLDVTIYPSRLTTKTYPDEAPLILSVVPINGTKSVFIGRFKVARFMNASVKNNATGANATNVLLGYELFKYT
jgi:hypothetical protein